jgi:hypothetical protein
VIEAFKRLFAERGLPLAIRSDNGLPFTSPNGLYNLSKLLVYWLRLGLALERIKPGHPQQNGRHERMHLTLKKEATRPPGHTMLRQQARFDAFINEVNDERPHEALAMKVPNDVYAASPRPYAGLREIGYPFHDRDALVTHCGRICMLRQKINISTVMAGQKLGLKEVEDGIWLVSFLHYDLGHIDWNRELCKPSTTRSARGCYHVLGTRWYRCLRYGHCLFGCGGLMARRLVKLTLLKRFDQTSNSLKGNGNSLADANAHSR